MVIVLLRHFKQTQDFTSVGYTLHLDSVLVSGHEEREMVIVLLRHFKQTQDFTSVGYTLHLDSVLVSGHEDFSLLMLNSDLGMQKIIIVFLQKTCINEESG